MRRLGTLAAVVLLVSSVLPLPAAAIPVLTAAKSDTLVVDMEKEAIKLVEALHRRNDAIADEPKKSGKKKK